MPKLTDSQLVILTNASQREGGSALPVPKSTKLQGGALRQVLKHLLKKGLLDEQMTQRNLAAWRESNDQRFTLAITDSGRAAIGGERDADSKQRSVPAKRLADKAGRRLERRAEGPKSPRKRQGPRARAGTKQSVLIELLDRPDGAILAEAVKATGWQPHSVRGAISGTLKRKLGLTVVSDEIEGRGRVYRICRKR